ncbi:MAG: hypothetical protein ACKJSG_17325 [Lentisphaeria bacterium]
MSPDSKPAGLQDFFRTQRFVFRRSRRILFLATFKYFTHQRLFGCPADFTVHIRNVNRTVGPDPGIDEDTILLLPLSCCFRDGTVFLVDEPPQPVIACGRNSIGREGATMGFLLAPPDEIT